MRNIVVYTVVSNGCDNLRAPAVIDSSFRYICFTNTPQIVSVHPWEFRPLYMPNGMSPARYSRLPKILPHLFFDADASIYHDANFSLLHRPQDLVNGLLRPGVDVALHAHPGRRCLYDEGELCANSNIGDPVQISIQLDAYRRAGHPRNWGLWACGFMVRRHSPELLAFNERWYTEFELGCARDQISFPFAARNTGIGINTLSDRIYGNEWVRFHWHAAWKTKDDNPNFIPERLRLQDRFDRLREIAGSDERTTYDAHA